MRRVGVVLCLATWLGSGLAAMAGDSPSAPARALSPEARDRFVMALAALKGGEASTAANEFGDASWASTPLSEYALLFRAESLLQSGNMGAARALAQRAADAPLETRLVPSALLRAATVLSGAGDEAGAATLLRRFLAQYPDHPSAARARLALGQALLADGRTEEAVRAFEELWILSPASPQAESAGQQLRVLADRGLLTSSLTRRERVERAERLLTAGQADRAQGEAETLLADGLPAELQGQALRIVFEASRRAGRYEAAQAAIARALSTVAPEARASWLLDLARLQKPRSRDQALASLDKLVREYPKSPEVTEALLLKGRLLEEASRTKEAEATYRKLVVAHPDGTEEAAGLWRLGWLSWFRGAYAEAQGSWARIPGSRGGQPYREASAYWLARADEMRGDAEPASRRLAKLQREAPRSYYGILAGQRSGRQLLGSSVPPVSLPADPVEALRTDAHFTRVEALRAVGLGTFAEEEMAEMTRRAFGDPKLLYALSVAYVQDTRYHLALRILRRHFSSLARTGDTTAPRAFWEMFYPMGWRSEMVESAGRAAIDPLLVAAVVREESSYYSQARSRVGARGLMQLMPETARPMAQARHWSLRDGDLLDEPAANLELGSAYLAGLLREFGDARLAVAAYNAGPTRVREWWGGRHGEDLEVWVEQIPFDETRGFVKRVMLSWAEYRRLYGPVVPAEAAATEEGRSSP
ncbi:MAG TPA: transglycosylase SLT domain-containing protein [Candidatus Methylomirabilis sp.]|nr:transglycosylase SLT domain-containing protein [Candidatus Methylomirabilis sp.]